MKNRNYLFYSEYFKGGSLLGKEILVSKTKTSYLIGPLINNNFDNNSFYKRLISNSIYSLKIYKKIPRFKCNKMIEKYKDILSDNEVLEIFDNGDVVKHKIIKVPGEKKMNKNRLILNRDEILKVLGKEYKGLSDIFSDKFGIVNAMLERHELDKYNLYMYQCLSANTKKLFDISRDISSGGLGVNEDKSTAMTSCLAEALERYCMSYIPKSEIISCKKEELDKKHVFMDFSTYSDKQYDSFDDFLNPNTDVIEWTKIYDIKDKKKYMYWPASLIYLPFDINKVVAETTSTGMAAGFSVDECIMSGLMELIERDSLMINFMQRLNPPEVDIDTILGNNKEFINNIRKDYNIKIYKLYTDFNVPIYLSIIYKTEMKKIHYGIGACASLDSDFAINKSLKECLFTYFYSLNIMDARQKNPKKIKTLYEHFLYYQGDDFDNLLFDSKKIKYKKEKISFNEVLINLKKNNINVYYKNLTTDDIKDTGIKVVKVIAPSLIDLNKSHIYPRLGARRFFEVPKKLGLECSDYLTEMPHPFP